MHFDKLIRTFVRADNAHEHRDTGIRMGDRPVMLSLVLSEANGAAKISLPSAPDLSRSLP